MQLRQLLQQRLHLLQIERVEAFGEPAVDPERAVRELAAVSPGHGGVAPCSSQRVVPKTSLAACAQQRARGV